ncbi:MAG: CARDB domain-containing protein [Anaerolineae bacterium]
MFHKISSTRWLPLSGLALAVAFVLIFLQVQTQALPPSGRPTPTPALPGGPEALGPMDGLPDLIVEAIQLNPLRPLVGVTTTIRVRIANVGEGDVAPANNFFVDLYVDPAEPPGRGTPGQPGTAFQGVQGFTMKAGARLELEFPYVFSDTRTYPLFAQVDTDGNVVEADEDNNVLGPVEAVVGTTHRFTDETHSDFLQGFSNLDLSYPQGMIALSGLFEQPFLEPGDVPPGAPHLYDPDFRVTEPISGTQIAPSITRDLSGTLYVVWEDGRNGETTDRDIYFARSSDRGTTWSPAVRVNQDGPGSNQRTPKIVYDDSSGRLYAVWQDFRRGHGDIFFARSSDGGDTWEEPLGGPVNDDLGEAAQLRPSIAVDGDGVVYLVWQDRRNGNDDVYFAASENGGLTWTPNILVTDEPSTTRQAQTSPSVAVGRQMGKTIIYVVWEDGRGQAKGDPADIYFVWGSRCTTADCPPYTFHVDKQVDNAATGVRTTQPTMAVSAPTWVITATEVFTPESPGCIVPPPVTTTVVFNAYYEGTAVHFAWQDYRNAMPDIYYAWTFAPIFDLVQVVAVPDLECWPSEPFEPMIESPFGPNYPIYGNVRVNGLPPEAPDDYVAPPGSGTNWGAEPSWQGDPALSLQGKGTDGVYIAWSDARNFDSWRYQVYVAAAERPDLQSADYEVKVNAVVNDNTHLTRYLGPQYDQLRPASVRQYRPALTYHNPPPAGELSKPVPYVVWDDDRYDDPLGGTARVRSIFLARPGRAPSPGVYISRVFDGGPEAHWYLLDWWGVTAYGTKILVQTRTGDTPWPDASWSDWTGPVFDPEYHQWAYQAPGPVVGSDQLPYPQARYFQYKVLLFDCLGFWKPTWTHEGGEWMTAYQPGVWVDQVRVHYQPKTWYNWLPLNTRSWAGESPQE